MNQEKDLKLQHDFHFQDVPEKINNPIKMKNKPKDIIES